MSKFFTNVDINSVQEEMFDEFNDAEFPLGIDDLVSTSEPVNKVPLRTPVDFAYLVKNEGVLQGTGEFFKVFFGQVNSSLLDFELGLRLFCDI